MLKIKKRVLYTGAFRFPEGDAAAPRVLNNAKLLRALGYEVIFISWGGKQRKSDLTKDGTFYYQGFRYINTGDIDVKRKNIFDRVFHHFFDGKNSLAIINQLINNVDFVIGYNPSMYFTNKMQVLCKKYSIPFVSDITEWFNPDELPGGKFAPPSWINELNMRFTQKRVKNKIVISSFLDRYYKSSNNIILPPLVDCNEGKWNISKSILPPFDGVRLVYAGTPTKKDLLEVMLNAIFTCVKRGLNLQFVVVGVSKENILNYPHFKELISLPINFVFCGIVPQVDVPYYYHDSDFSVIIREPTRKNMAGFPTKLAESMMAGCPVLLNSTSDISKFVHSGSNGFLIKNWSVIEFENVLSKIVTLTKEEKDKLKLNAKKSAMINFEFSKYIISMENFIKKLK